MWEKLTVGQFITLYDIDANPNLNEIEKQQKMLSIIEDKKEEEYDNIKYRELLKLYATKLAFFNEMPETKPVDFIEVNGNRYKFNFEISEITAGQYIDINSFGGDIVSLNKIAACFFLPMKGKRYMEYGTIPHDKVAEDLLDANFLEVYGCMVFFYQLFKELIKDIITSSDLTEELKTNLIHLWKDGVGFSPLNR